MNPAFENLEKLSQDLYQKLITDAEAEINELKAQAAQEREILLREAQLEAESMRKNAEREADLFRKRKIQELEQEALQLKGRLQEDLESFLKEEIVKRPLNDSLQTEAFVSEMVLGLLSSFNSDTHQVSWPKQWSEQWLDSIRKKLPDWRFDLGDNHQLLIREGDQGLEFHFGAESFEKLLETYFDQELRHLILKND